MAMVILSAIAILWMTSAARDAGAFFALGRGGPAIRLESSGGALYLELELNYPLQGNTYSYTGTARRPTNWEERLDCSVYFGFAFCRRHWNVREALSADALVQLDRENPSVLATIDKPRTFYQCLIPYWIVFVTALLASALLCCHGGRDKRHS